MIKKLNLNIIYQNINFKNFPENKFLKQKVLLKIPYQS